VTTAQNLLGGLAAIGQWAVIVPLFLLLVVPHEGGHFAMARLFGVRVREFSVGMGSRIWSTVRSQTLYAVRVVPLGGYVRLAGMEPDDYEDPDGFHAKPAYQRLLVLVGGPAVNFLVAMVIMTGVMLFTQVNDDPGKVVGVIKPSGAYSAGIAPGDSIRAVDGRPLRRSDDIHRAEDRTKGQQALTFTVRRADGTTFQATITPRYDTSAKRYLIGIDAADVVTPGQAVLNGLTFPFTTAAAIGQGVLQVATGQIPGGFLGPSGVSGVVGFTVIAHQAATEGLVNYLVIAALLSMALGITNLLPLPALDGGRIVVVLLEKLRGRPFDREREMAVQRAGLLALIVLMAVIAVFDVQRIVTGQFPGT
jgi:regulator of sigma E protease